MVAQILGPDGRLVSSADLNKEVAIPMEIGVRAVNREGVASGLSPESLAALLQDAAAGYARRYLTLAEEMEERYLHYASQLQTRRLALEAIEPSIEVPEGVPSKIADAVHELVEAHGFRDMVGDLTDGIAKGYSAVEMVWDYTGGMLRPVRYVWRDPRFFQFERIGLTELRLAVDGSLDGVPLPDHKFVRHMPRSKMGVPLRRGVARTAAWAFMLQSFSLKDWAAFSEVYGMPLRLGRYPANATNDDKRVLLQAVRSIASDAAAVVRSQIVWDKGRLIISRGHYHWRHETAWYAVRRGRTARWTGDRKQVTVWSVLHRRSETGHGTQKPVELMRRAILNHTRPGERVYDPFVGSGTTIVAAEETGRICHAIELHPPYVDVAVARWTALTGCPADLLFRRDGGFC